MSKFLSMQSGARRPARGARELAVLVLSAASGLLGRLAAALSRADTQSAGKLPPVLEFYADAAAPEGALYLDGELVGYLPGVKRL